MAPQRRAAGRGGGGERANLPGPRGERRERGPEPSISRRRFLTEVGGLAGGLAVLGLPGEGPLRGEGPLPGRGRAVVGLGRGRDRAEALRGAVELSGGLDFLRPGETVLVKPNACCPNPHPATTSPAMLAAVLALVREREPGRLLVGDQTFFIQDTLSNMGRTGLDAAAREGADELVAFDDVDRIHLRPPGARHFPDGYRVPALLREVDHVINLACVKTHRLARFTMALKNAIGLIDADSRRHYHGRRRREEYGTFAAMIAEMALAVRPGLNILEGAAAFVTGGPSEGEVVEPDLVIASRDPVAADVVGLAVLRYHGAREGVPFEDAIQGIAPADQPVIREAVRFGIGVGDPRAIEVRGRRVAEIEAIRGWTGRD